jgi:hypothetical protein
MVPGFIRKKREKKKKEIQKEDLLEPNSILLKKKTVEENEQRNIIRIQKDRKMVVKLKDNNLEKLETNQVVTEQDQGIKLPLPDVERNGISIIPLNTKEQIEKIILKILYDEKSVKTLKGLTEKALEVATKKRITISEKNINNIIYQLNKEKKIQFTQTEGWKIRI